MTVPLIRTLLSAGGLSLLSQGLALFRQSLGVSFFGLGRELDAYVTLASLLMVTVQSSAQIVESSLIGLLTENRTLSGKESGQQPCGSFVLAGSLWSLSVVGVLALFYPLLIPLFTAGFSGAERAALDALAIDFLPWALLVIPFSALGACLKSAYDYQSFFIGEFLIAVVSTFALLCWHSDVGQIALAFGYGYGTANLFLLWRLARRDLLRGAMTFPWRKFLIRFTRHLGTNQLATAQTLAERFWFSYLPAGNIAAIVIVQQLVNSLVGLLSFREAYLVHLTEPEGQGHRITRLLSGFFLMAISSLVWIYGAAEPLSALLFGYGKMAQDQVALLADLLGLSLPIVLLTVIAMPVWRLLLLQGRYKPLARVYAANTLITLIGGIIVIQLVGWGANGMILIGILNALVGLLVALRYAKKYGARWSHRQRVFLGVSLISFLFVGGAGTTLIVQLPILPLFQILLVGAAAGLFMLIYQQIFRRECRDLMKGDGFWAIQS